MRTGSVIIWLVAAAGAALLAGCPAGKDNGSDTSNCLVAEACCALALEETGENTGEGAEACEGFDAGDADAGWGDAGDLDGAGLVDDDGVLKLRPNTVTRVPVVWVTSTNEDMVAKYDSSSGLEVLRVPTWGNFPNRTAVASDGSVWITNRDSGSYIHLDVEGEVSCASEYDTCLTRAAAIDANGFAWIGCNNTGAVIKVDPRETEGTVEVTDGSTGETRTVPKCRELARVQLETTKPYGIAADNSGDLWVGVFGGGSIAKIDTSNDTVIGEYAIGQDPMILGGANCFGMYGMAIDLDGNPWLANMSCGTVVKVNGKTGAVMGVFTGDGEMSAPRAAGIDRSGHIWVADNGTQYVHEFASDGTWLQKVDVGCGSTNPGTLGTGSDMEGNMWTVLQNVGKVVKFTTGGSVIGCYPEETPATPLLAGPYTYSDLTGSTLDLVTSKLGRWRGRVEGPSVLHWLLVSYRADVPDGTRVCVRARTASSAAGLETAAWTAPYCDSAPPPNATAVDLTGRPEISDSQFLELELQLTSQDASLTPAVANVSVAARLPE